MSRSEEKVPTIIDINVLFSALINPTVLYGARIPIYLKAHDCSDSTRSSYLKLVDSRKVLLFLFLKVCFVGIFKGGECVIDLAIIFTILQ
ncbi:MAG: hypothetical protein ACTSRC_20355 [Candidatus Helarchaeota archaeon]